MVDRLPDRARARKDTPAERAPEMVPIRYGRSIASPFAFCRGGALLMALDLAQTPSQG